jgi:hypothetical protein
MNWRSGVKARHFVVALHDHFIDKFAEAELPFGTRMESAADSQPSQTLAIPASPQSYSPSEDRWCLQCMTLPYVPPIVQAFDDDASGFVSILPLHE